jgi:outer membrane cobalamin receptor
MSRIFLYFSFLFSITVEFIMAQPPADRGPMPMDGTITGKIIDNNNQFPIEYASVGLYRMRDSSLVTGALTDTAGNFALENLPYGRFYAEVKFLGYKKSRVNGIMINPNQKTAALGLVKLQGTGALLNQVEITGNRPPIEYKLDKKVVNVGQQIAAAGGTAVDVLENTPSVQTDVDGNVTLRGSSSFTVLIDGKPTVLKGSEALQQIPASTIDQIEIITNPSAKYDPDGSAGIINIVMKKQKISGMNGVLNISAGTGDKYNGDFLINFRQPKLNYFIGGNFNDTHFKMKGFTDQRTTRNDTISFLESNTKGQMHRTGKELKGGIDFYLNDKNTLSFSGNVSKRNFYRLPTLQNYSYNTPSTFDSYYLQTNSSVSEHKSFSVSSDYLLRLNKDGHQLAATVYYSRGPEDDNTDMLEESTNSVWVRDDLSNIHQQTVQSGTESEFRAKIDYTKPIGKGKLEAGYQGRYEKTTGSYVFNNLVGTDVIEDPLQANDVKFTDHIESGYLTFSNSMKIFEYQLGMRGELTDRNLVKKLSDEEYPIHRFDYFPSVHLSRQLPWNMQVLASYSRRINRPDDRQLDPFPRYIDRTDIRKGNPALKPEFADSYELNFQKRMGEGFVSVEGYYKQTKDLISQSTNLVDSIAVQSFSNFKKDYSLGTEIMLNMPLTKWWTFNASSTIYKYHLDAKDSTQNTNTWNSRASSTFHLNWGMQIQANFFYNAPTITPDGTRKGFYFTSIGVKQDLFKKKASLTFQARDLFGNMKFVNTSVVPGLYKYSTFKRESPVFTLTFSYRINNYKQQMMKRNSDTNETDFNNNGGGGME